MKRALVLTLLIAPFAANATLLTVHFYGTVTETDGDGFGKQVGDSVDGVFYVNGNLMSIQGVDQPYCSDTSSGDTSTDDDCPYYSPFTRAVYGPELGYNDAVSTDPLYINSNGPADHPWEYYSTYSSDPAFRGDSFSVYNFNQETLAGGGDRVLSEWISIISLSESFLPSAGFNQSFDLEAGAGITMNYFVSDGSFFADGSSSVTGYRASLSRVIASVPEPGALCLLGAGILALGITRRRRAA